MSLSPAQMDRFHTEGYLVVENALADADLRPVIREYEERIDRRARELHAAGKLSRLYEEESFERRFASICRETMELYPEMDIMHHRGRAAFDFLRNDHLLDLVERFVGPEITCSPIQHIRAKLPSGLSPALVGKGDTHVAPWHQDAGVTWAEADPHFILTVWIPMVDATPENGCMEILPRWNTPLDAKTASSGGPYPSRWNTPLDAKTASSGGPYPSSTLGIGLLPHHSKAGVGTTILPDEMPDVQPVALPVRKGSVIFMHKEIPHRSTPNYSDTVRWSMDLRYQQTGTPTGRPFHPEFVVRSRANPASVLTDHARWGQMWEDGLASAKAAGVSLHRWAKAE
jgi:ectoine hydroxylase-related dioxygenase (phytanoyl-CoA dioxygenase family)